MLMQAVDTRAVKVQAGGAMWRLRSLTAMGHSNLRMARALGVHKDVVNRLAAGDVENITAGLFGAVDALWEAWWDKRPPERNQHERIAASKARNKARARKWPTPLNLDEEKLDETGYRPTALWHPATGLGIASDYPLGIREAALCSASSCTWTTIPRRRSVISCTWTRPISTLLITSGHRRISLSAMVSTTPAVGRISSACRKRQAARGTW